MTRDSPGNVLVLAHRAPHPPDRGDRIRTFHILRHLANHFRVYLGALLDEPVDEDSLAALRQLTTELVLPPLGRQSRWLRAAWSLGTGRTATEGLFASRELRDHVRRWARSVRFDAVIAFCTSMIQYANVPELRSVPLIVDLIDVDSQKWLDYAAATKGLKRFLFNLEGRRVRRLECSLPQRAAAITLVSQAEVDLYCDFCPNTKTLALPNGVDLDYFTEHSPVCQPPACQQQSNQCVFVGVLDYRANVESLVWFCHEVWPLVIAKKPDAVFAVVGKSPAPAVKQLASREGVRLVGPVADVRPYVAQSRFSVAPLQIARGVQNKVLEAMAMGKPVVASPQALEGLAVEAGREALSASSPGEWADVMLKMYADDRLTRTLGNQARLYVQAHHAWSVCLAPLTEALGVMNVPSHLPAIRSREPVVRCAVA